MEHRFYLVEPGERPYSPMVAEHLWGEGCDFDSDGNADEDIVGGWTELTVALRPECNARVDIDPIDDRLPLVLIIRSDTRDLAQRAAAFLQGWSGGTLLEQPPEGRG